MNARGRINRRRCPQPVTWIGLESLEGRVLLSADGVGGDVSGAPPMEADVSPGTVQENEPLGFVATNPESGETRGMATTSSQSVGGLTLGAGAGAMTGAGYWKYIQEV
ncbi:MAG: hypothetical protein CMJ18_18545 [Phycisphaeraceae bacterium]|nr:hypothetical protein [Phycisphaeraceae bacterium]